MLRRLLCSALLGALLFACESDPGGGNVDPSDAGAAPFECTVEPPTSCPDPAPRFADVAPIFKQRCAGCHASNWSGPWPLDTYSHIADWGDVVRAHLLDCSMPPPEAGVPLPNEESVEILTWIRCGTPQ